MNPLVYDALTKAMSSNEYGAITLGQLIDTLAAADQDEIVLDGFTHPGSYRGVYAFLAFSPATGTRVADMLRHARNAVGATFEGYKGGEFTMTRETPCFIAEYGYSGEEDAITADRLKRMIGIPVVAAAPSSMPERPYILEQHRSVDGAFCILIPDDVWSEFKSYVCALESLLAKLQEPA